MNNDCKQPAVDATASDPGITSIFSDVRFADLALHPAIMQGVEDAGFEHCTPIQAETLPLALAGRDVAGQAQTGTGKTAAFLIAAMHRVLTGGAAAPEPTPGKSRPRILAVAPTRELAVQIHRDAEVLGRHTGLRTGVVFGGTGYEDQRLMLERGLDVLIGTPGRLIDYQRQGIYDLRAVEAFILDEADRMFDLGFIRDIRYICRRLPPPERRLSMLFSATLSQRVLELAYEHMHEAQHIDARPPDQVVVDKVTQRLFHVGQDEKIPLLVGLLQNADIERAIVFVNTRQMADRLGDTLQDNHLSAGVLSGDVPQRKRLALLEKFHTAAVPILVATDVAARGLHIPGVSHVFNFDLPQDAEDYVHRIGRTARVGEKGEAISFGCERYVYSLMDIEELLGTRLPVEAVEDSMLAELAPPSRRRPKSGPSRGGGRRSGGGGGGGRRGGGGGGRRSGGRREAAAHPPS